MSLRLKLIFFMFAFLATASILGVGVTYIFKNLNDNLELIKKETETHKLYIDFENSIRDYLQTTKSYALTGDIKFRRRHNQKLAAVYKIFAALEASG